MKRYASPEQIDDLVVTLMACVVACENLPEDSMSLEKYQKVASLVRTLAYQTLPGGSYKEETDEGSGMRLGWHVMGVDDHGAATIERLRRVLLWD